MAAMNWNFPPQQPQQEPPRQQLALEAQGAAGGVPQRAREKPILGATAGVLQHLPGFLGADDADPSRIVKLNAVGTVKTKRVHVGVRVGGRCFDALVDTGATICAVAKEVFDSIDSKSVGKWRDSSRLRITSAGNEQMKVEGVVELNVEILGRSVTWPMAVIRQLSSQMIIGDDLLSELGARVDVKEKRVELAQTEEVNELVAKDRVVIPPFATRIVKTAVGGPKRNGARRDNDSTPAGTRRRSVQKTRVCERRGA
jgi:predicted aspartyl protease